MGIGLSAYAAGSEPQLTLVYTNSDPVFADAISAFAKDQQMEVDAVWMDQSELTVRLLAASEDDAMPDLLISSSDLLGQYQKIQASALPPRLLAPLEQQQPELLDALRASNGRVYGLPLTRGNHLVLYYNRRFIDQPANDWNSLVAQRSSVPENISLVGWSTLDMYWLIPITSAFGPLPADGSSINFRPQASGQAFEFVWNLVNSDLLDGECNYECNLERFLRGEMAYHINGVWELENFRQALAGQLGVAPLPKLNNHPMRSYYSTSVIILPHQSLTGDHQRAIEKFIRYTYTTAFQNTIARSISNFPLLHTADLNPGNSSRDPLQKTVVSSLDNSLPMPHRREMMLMWEAMLKGYARFGSGAFSTEEICELMNSYVASNRD